MKTEQHPPVPVSPKLEEVTSLVRLHVGHLSPEQAMRGERLIRARVNYAKHQAQGVTGRQWFSLWAAIAVAASVAVAVALFVKRRDVPSALSCQTERGAVFTGQVIKTQGQRSRLQFSDGTQVELATATEATLRSVTEHGASVVLSQGRLHASVVHGDKSEWYFDAGPNSVHVTGTSFELVWEPTQDRFDLKLEQGAVTVQAPVSNGPIPVRSGQWLTILGRSNEVVIRALSAPLPQVQSSTAPGGSELRAPAREALPETGKMPGAAVDPVEAARTEPSSSPPARKWSQALAQGHLEQIVAEADAQGLEHCLATASAENLSALADAARYTRRTDTAKSALLALRRRFSGSERARDSAFLLGKLAEAEHDSRLSLSYFDTYLRESPSGRYAAESLGRKLATLRQMQGSRAARPVAEEYLSRYPKGAYAEVAHAIVSEP